MSESAATPSPRAEECDELRAAVWEWYVARGDARHGEEAERARFAEAEKALKRLAVRPATNLKPGVGA